MVALILVLGLVWLALRLMLGAPLTTKIIGEVEIDGSGRLCLGRAHDGDLSYNYFARIRGHAGGLDSWTWVDSREEAFGACETAVSSDQRFACIACNSSDLMVIFDAQEQELWWRGHDQWDSDTKFVRAWRALRSINPRIPEPPF
jgi:hypothetical protein